MSFDTTNLKFAAVGLSISGLLIHKGLRTLKRVHAIEDIPTSNIDTASIGDRVEVKGRVVGANLLKSPIQGRSCSAFVLKLYKKVSRGKSSYWKHVSSVYSSRFIYISDHGDAIAAVDLGTAEFDEWQKYLKFDSAKSHKVSKDLRKILEKTSLVNFDDSWYKFSTAYKAKEIVFAERKMVYAFGSALTKVSMDKPINNPKLNFLDESNLILARKPSHLNNYVGFNDKLTLDQVKFILTQSRTVKSFINTSKVFISFRGEKRLVSRKRKLAYICLGSGFFLICLITMLLCIGPEALAQLLF